MYAIYNYIYQSLFWAYNYIIYIYIYIYIYIVLFWAFLVAQMVKNLPAMPVAGFDPWIRKVPSRR